MPTTRQKKLVGPVIALRTFRTDEGELNLAKQRKHLRWLLDQGINEGNGVIMTAAGGGEGYFMSEDEWKAVVDLAAEECKGRVPCVAGIFELSAREAVRKAKYCEQAGIEFVQVQPPHYMVPTDDEVYYHFKMINDAADVGIFCYNAPWAMPQPGYEFKPALLERLANLRNAEGVKWSSYNLRNFVLCARLFANRLNFISNQPHFVLSLPMKLGMSGFINSDGMVAPRLVLHMWDLWKQKRYDDYDALVLRTYVDPYVNIHTPEEIGWVGMGEGPYARLGMESMGCKMGPPFPTQQPLPAAIVKNYQERLADSGILNWVDWTEDGAPALTAQSARS